MGWWDWVEDQAKGQSNDERVEGMSAEEKGREFRKLVSRCVVLHNLASNVTPAVLVVALGQFGCVAAVKLIKDVSDPKLPFIGAAVVEMSAQEQAQKVVTEAKEYLFMIGRIPRPARVIIASDVMMLDHPWRPNPNNGRYRWVSKKDNDAKLAFQKRDLVRNHATEVNLLWKAQKKEEAERATIQQEAVEEHCEKWKLLRNSQQGGTIPRLKSAYGLADRS